jgi:hypothetical protein
VTLSIFRVKSSTSNKIVILRGCDFIGFVQKPMLKTKRLGASKSAKNQ